MSHIFPWFGWGKFFVNVVLECLYGFFIRLCNYVLVKMPLGGVFSFWHLARLIFIFLLFIRKACFWVLSLGVWLAIYRGQWLLVGILAALLSATRPNGIMIIVPLLYVIFQAFRNKSLKPSMLFVVLAPLGALSYMLFLHTHFGDAFAFLNSEKSSWHRSGWDFHIFFVQLVHNYLFFPYDTFVFFMTTFLIVRVIQKKYWPEAIYFIMMLFPALASGSFLSLARFSGCLFTFYFALVLIVENKPCLRTVLFSLCLGLSGVYVYAWLQHCPFLM